jgi:hypothetical protein
MLRRRPVVLACLAALALSACGLTAQPQARSSGAVSTASPRPTPSPSLEVRAATSVGLRWPISIGADHSPILRLAPDPSKPGVWFWSWTSREAYAYFYNLGSRTLSSWAVGSSSGVDGLDPYADSGIAVAPNGDVWLGAYNQLVRLDPATGQVSRWTIPAPAVDPLASAALQPWHDVNSIAIDGSGRIIIGMTAASSLQVFEPAGQAFTSIALPKIGEVQGIAALLNGTVAVAMQNLTEPGNPDDTVVLVSPSGVISTVHTESGFVTSNGRLFGAGQATHATFDGAGVVTAVPVNSSDTPSERIQPSMGALLPDGRMVLATSGGVAIASPSSTEYLGLPSRACPGISVPSSALLPPATGTECPVSPVALAVDSAGNIWIAPNLPQDAVGLIPAGSY